VERKKAELSKLVENDPERKKMKKLLISALKSQDQNESLDFWLTLYDRSLNRIKHNTRLEVHFLKFIPNKTSQVCSNDF